MKYNLHIKKHHVISILGLLLIVHSLKFPHQVNAGCMLRMSPIENNPCITAPYTNACTATTFVPYCCSESSTECQSPTPPGPYDGGTPAQGAFSQYYDQFVTKVGLKTSLTSIPGIINAVIPIILTFAGLVLFLMLLAGGFQMLTSASNPEAADKGKQRLTAALIGFLIIFTAYWLTQIMEIVLGVNILK